MRRALVFGILAVTGCATTVPEAIREAPPGDISVVEARRDAAAYAGQRVRWGGTVASVENRKDETWIEIVARDLGSTGRPRDTDRSQGRFIARVQGFLDPAVYTSGRQITVSGTLEQAVTRPIGDYSYTFPLVRAESVYLWERLPERRDYYYYDPFWPYDSFWPYPYWRHPYYPYPYLR